MGNIAGVFIGCIIYVHGAGAIIALTVSELSSSLGRLGSKQPTGEKERFRGTWSTRIRR